MKKKIAEIISLVFNPLFLFLAIILVGAEQTAVMGDKIIYATLAVLFLNGVIPSYLYLSLARKGVVIDDIIYNKDVLKNRGILLAWISVILLSETLVLYFFKKPQPVFAVLVSLFFLALALFLVNLYRKISLHAAGITYFVLAILFLFGEKFSPLLLLIPLVVWSRLCLLRHNLKQLLSGIGVAAVIITLVFYFADLLPFI